MKPEAYAVYGGMSMERFNRHWLVLRQCEAGGAKPAVYRELLEIITNMRARFIELEGRASSICCLPTCDGDPKAATLRLLQGQTKPESPPQWPRMTNRKEDLPAAG